MRDHQFTTITHQLLVLSLGARPSRTELTSHSRNWILLVMVSMKEKNTKMFTDCMITFSESYKITNSQSLFSGKNKLMKILMKNLSNHCFAKMTVLKISKMVYLKSTLIILLLGYLGKLNI